jgi:hypothetical protein
MKKFVRENLYENFVSDEEELDNELDNELDDDDDVEIIDAWEKPDEEIEVADNVNNNIDADIEEDEFEILGYSDELEDLIDNELNSKEFNRIPINFKMKKNLSQIVSGIPMAKLSNGNYVFKTSTGLKKINLNDIIMIDENKKQKKGIKLNETMEGDYPYVDYLFDISNYLMLNPENVQAVLNIHNADEEEAKIEITNELEDNDDIYGTKGMYMAGIDAEDAALKIINQYQG